MAKTIAVIAGEDSGDALAALVIEQLAPYIPDFRILAVGGERLRAGGRCELIADSSDLSVVGITEVITRYLSLRRAFHRIKTRLLEEKVEHLITIDFPGFNLRLASALKQHGVTTTHMVSPQVWAWREGRVETIRSAISNLIVLFPFEVEFYRQRGIAAQTFGHPLLDALDADSENRVRDAIHFVGNDPRPIIAWLPGSRRGELERHLPVFSKAISQLGSEQYRHVISKKESLDASLYWIPDIELSTDSSRLLQCASVAVVKSGTATFESMVIGTPQLVVYRVSKLTHLIGKRLAKVTTMAMPNILAGARIVPELIQDDCTAERISGEVVDLLNGDRAREIRERYEEVLSQFERGGTAERIAAYLLEIVQ